MAAILTLRLFAFLATVLFAVATKLETSNLRVAITYQIQGDAAIKSIVESATNDEKPVTVYPKKPRYMAWGFYRHYTIALCHHANDDSPRQFRWQTEYCGAVNKSLAVGQTSFEFTFEDLAADFSKAQCNFTLDEIEMLANSPSNSIFVEDVGEKRGASQGLASFPILHMLTVADMRLEKCGQPEPMCRYNIDVPSRSRTGSIRESSRSILLNALLLVTAFWIGTVCPKRQLAAKSIEQDKVKSKEQEKAN